MDPNKLLEELLELSTANSESASLILFESMQRAGELFVELDDWFAKGGFTPALWKVVSADMMEDSYAKAQIVSNSGRDLLSRTANEFLATDGCCPLRKGLQFFRAFLKLHGLIVGGYPLPSIWRGEMPK